MTRRAWRGVVLTGGSAAKAIERGVVFDRTRKDSPLHGGVRPRMGARDLWDTSCWCGWSSTGHERRDLAAQAGDDHLRAARSTPRPSKSAKPTKSAKTSARRVTGVIRSTPTLKQRAFRDAQLEKASAPPRPANARSTIRPATQWKGPDGSRYSRLRYQGHEIVIDGRGGIWRAKCSDCGWNQTAVEREQIQTKAVAHASVCRVPPAKKGRNQPLA